MVTITIFIQKEGGLMSLNSFIAYLQQLLSMVNPDNDHLIVIAKEALSATIALAEASGKIDSVTRRTMDRAEYQFDYLIEHARDFAGVPGRFKENEQKRQGLKMMLVPHC